jgi:hypothetical protein
MVRPTTPGQEHAQFNLAGTQGRPRAVSLERLTYVPPRRQPVHAGLFLLWRWLLDHCGLIGRIILEAERFVNKL